MGDGDKFVALIPRDGNDNPVHSWENVESGGQRVYLGSGNPRDNKGIVKTTLKYYVDEGLGEDFPLIGRVCHQADATHVITKDDRGAYSTGGFVLWASTDKDLPHNRLENIYIVAQDAEFKTELVTKDYEEEEVPI